MSKITHLCLGLLLFSSLLTACAEQRPAYDQNFSAAEFGLGPLAPSAETSLDQQSRQLLALVQQELAAAPASLPATAFKSVLQVIPAHLQSLLPDRETEINTLLEPYRSLAREPVGYYQIPVPANPALQQITADTNGLLKRYYRMLSGIKLSEALLPRVRTDIATQTAGQPSQQAATGLAGLTHLHLLLQAQAELERLQPDLQAAETAAAKKLNALREQVKANPNRNNPAVEPFQFYAGLTSHLSTASQNLSKIKAEIPAELTEIRQLMGTLAEQI